MEGRGIKQELANVPFEGWIINPDVHGLLDGPCDVVHLPIQYEEVAQLDVMISGVGMVIDGERGPEMFLEPFSRGPSRLPFLLLITL